MDFVVKLFNVSQVLLPVYTFMLKVFGAVIPLLLLLGIVDAVGSIIAKKDEANLQIAFDKHQLRNGSPILMYKKENKKNGVTIREFYSFIPMKVWVEHMEEIEDAMNIHLVEELQYGGKSNGNRIVMYSASGRKPSKRGDLYDDTF